MVMTSGWQPVSEEFQDYLRDESRSTGFAEYIEFPQTEEDLLQAVGRAKAEEMPITVQGARTGISGGAVPGGGLILNLTRMNKILGLRYDGDSQGYSLRVQPGVILSELKEMLEKKQFDTQKWSAEDIEALQRLQQEGAWFFPPDPTEASASIGGMIACNASGARSFHFGPIRNFVTALRVLTAQGDVLDLKRSEHKANDYGFSLVSEAGNEYIGRVPSYPRILVKNAAGYYSGPDMDLLDLFIGSEGTLGIVAEAEIRLLPQPAAIWSMTAFFPDEAAAVHYVQTMKEQHYEGAYIAALEYFNSRALNLLRAQRTNPAFAAIPEMPAEFHTAVYTEIHGEDDDIVSEAMMTACEHLIEAGGDDDMTWIATNSREMEKLHFFRHATPEAVNLLIDERRKEQPKLTKLGTDMAVPDTHLGDVLDLYNQTLEATDLEWVMFGHIGDNHIHVNILPHTMAEYEHGKKLYQQWAKEVIRMGGTVSAEHGIGRLKTAMLQEMYGPEGIRMMKEVKGVLDPQGRLNPGSIFLNGEN